MTPPMQEPLLIRIRQFYRRTQVVLILAILFPTLFTTAVGIVSLALYSDVKDIIFGVLTITFAVGIILGSFFVVLYTKKLQDLALKQTMFLANVSHELRSPLTAIKLYAQTLEKDAEGINRELCVEQIIRATSRLDRLIAQILEWKRITSKTDTIICHAISGNAPVMDATEHFLSVHPEDKDALILDLMADPPTLDLDRDSMESALFNLLDNAWKYSSDDRRIRLVTRLVSDASSISRFFEYRVEDNGFGIPQESLDKIFDVFYRADNTLAGASGVGLGLGIARSIVTAHGGSLFVDSEMGKGSSFIIRIPLSLPRKTNGFPKGSLNS